MKNIGTKNAACSSKFSRTGEEHYERRNVLLYGTAILACGGCAAGAQADQVTIQLFFTAFSPNPNPILTTNATLNGSSLTFSGTSTIAHTNGTDGILFLPDNNLAIGGQGGGAATGYIFEITNTGTTVATVTTPSNGTNITAVGGAGVTNTDVRGLIFDPHNSAWYYGTAADGSTSGTLGTATFNGTQAASAAACCSGARSHLRPNDKRHRLQQR
jgi:hypothetical protein